MRLLNIFNIFKKKSIIWYEFDIKRGYDLTLHPEVSKNSDIKEFSITTKYRYCPDNNLLEKKSRRNENEWFKSERTFDMDDDIKRIVLIHNRDKKLINILKK